MLSDSSTEVSSRHIIVPSVAYDRLKSNKNRVENARWCSQEHTCCYFSDTTHVSMSDNENSASNSWPTVSFTCGRGSVWRYMYLKRAMHSRVVMDAARSPL